MFSEYHSNQEYQDKIENLGNLKILLFLINFIEESNKQLDFQSNVYD